MKKLNKKDAKEIGDDLGINWNEVDINEFTMNNETRVMNLAV